MWFMIRCHHGCQLAPRWFLLFGKMVILVLIFHPSWKGVYIWGALKIYTWCMEVGNPYCQKKSQLGGCSTGVGFLAGWLGSARKRAISGYLKKSPSKQFLKLRFNSNDLDVSLSQDDSASTEGLQLGIPSKWNIILITTASQKKHPRKWYEMIYKNRVWLPIWCLYSFGDQKMLSGVRVSDFLASNSQIHSKRFGLRGVDEGHWRSVLLKWNMTTCCISAMYFWLKNA